jgi:type II secretory pathway pseudopilin PulG
VKKLNQVGDTIVEVLLSLTVLGMVIGTAFAVANRSLKQAQKSQERTQALKLAEGQVDSLKFLSESNNEADIETFKNIQNAATASQCLGRITDDEGDITIGVDSISDGGCQDGVFSYSIIYDNQNSHLFNVQVIWDSLGGNGQENVTIQYRVMQ